MQTHRRSNAKQSYTRDEFDFEEHYRILQTSGPLGLALGNFEQEVNTEMNKEANL